MITAIEMRLRTEQAIERCDELAKILENCKKTADTGWCSEYHYEPISKGSMKKLQQLGYTITVTDDPRDGYIAKISW